MKNLKKILIALLVLVTLVSSVAIVATAEENADMVELQKLYGNVDKYPDTKDKATQLAKTYTYLKDHPIDPATAGYADLVASMHAKSVEIANTMLDEINPKDSTVNKVTALNAVFAHIDACPPADGTAGYADVLAEVNSLNEEYIGKLYQEAEASTTTFAKQKVYTLIFKQLAYKPIDATKNAALIALCKDGAFAVAKQYLADYNATLGDTSDAKYFARANAAGMLEYFLEIVDLTGVNGAAAFISEAEDAIMASEKEVYDRMVELDTQANFDDYELTDGRYNVTFDDGKSLTTTNPNATNIGILNTDKNGNKYFTLHYGDVASHLFTEPSIKSDDLGMVLNVDMMFDDNFWATDFVMREAGVQMQTLFQFLCSNRDGNIEIVPVSSNGGASKNLNGTMEKIKGVLVPNVWFTVTLTYDKEERTGAVYINYVKVLDMTYGETIVFEGYRLGKSSTNQEISLDNLDFYQGTDFRIFDKFTKMSDADKFKYYVDYCVNEKYTATNRNAAYLKARELKATIPDNDEILEYKAKFDALDYENDVKKPAMKYNLDRIKDLVSKLPDSVDSETREAVAVQVAAIDAFIAANAELINRADPEYIAQAQLIADQKTAIERVINVEEFIVAVSKFHRATSYTSMSKHAASAQAIWTLADYNTAANIKYVESDPVVREFEKELNVKDAEPTDPGYVNAFDYFLTFGATMAERIKYENSKKILDCLEFITGLEGYEATEKFWGENIDFISVYIDVMRKIIVENNFNAEVEGVLEAIDTYYVIDSYFYEVLQQNHIATIEEQLEKYLATESFIEKRGICEYIKIYLEENDVVIYNNNLSALIAERVADESETLTKLEYLYLQYTSELASQEKDYESVLNENTRAFIGTVRTMTSVVTYTEIRALVDRASGYYYAMNVETEEAKDAVVLYNAYKEIVDEKEEIAESFIAYVGIIEAIDSYEEEIRADVLYDALVACAKLADGVDAEVEGAEAALDIYEDALKDYNKKVTAVNSEIGDLIKLTFSVRADFILNAALAVVAGYVESFN